MEKKLASSKLSPISFKYLAGVGVSGRSANADSLAFCNRTGNKSRGFTLIELLIVISIIVILASIATVAYTGYMKKVKLAKAISDIQAISLAIEAYKSDNGVPPDSLADVRRDNDRDPWGNPYQYLNIVTAKGKGSMRKDRFLVPINSDFDLYSMGEDGKSLPPLTAKDSSDDIIRANDGAYIGPAYAY